MGLFTRAISQNRNRQSYLGKKRLEESGVNHFSRGNDRNTRDPWNERKPFNQNYVLYAEADHCARDGPCVTAGWCNGAFPFTTVARQHAP